MINRLLGIIYILMNRQNITAAELAERFEVSVRTIYRDIDTLSMAGIPVYARKGKNGGISLTEQFVLNKMLLTEEEQQQILSALVSMEETGAGKEQETLRKLGEFFQTTPPDWLAIDFSDWSGTRGQLYEEIKEAILSHKVMSFDYYGQYHAMSRRTIEPVQLLFKEYTWYLRGFCRQRQAMRTFKVFRMKRVVIENETFVPKAEYYETAEDGQKQEASPPGGMTEITVQIDGKEAYRVYDRFEESELEELENGDFLVHMKCYPDDWVYGLILSFGPSAQVLSPEKVRLEMEQRVKKMWEVYQKI